eukprot:TRINITY_DN57294_c0_g1_i1.p1 TRINITY_DN57294_c0_g1~~TRINITY_DN57294_c0_g1_i1.p1  ORF type:complete len:250 (+),score=42.52 TRINITY_DN57294_c0_g1_i1:54-803(+)
MQTWTTTYSQPGGVHPMSPGQVGGPPPFLVSGPPQFVQQAPTYGSYGGPVMAAAPCHGSGSAMAGEQVMMPPIDVFVEASPEIQPTVNREQDGTISLRVPPLKVGLSTSCMPALPQVPGLQPFKPYEEFWVEMPELTHVVFAPWQGMGSVTAQARKRGAVLEVPGHLSLNANLKANSPFGTLLLQDVQVSPTMGTQQKIGETAINYQLKVEGALSVSKGTGNCGSDRLQVDLAFHFSASLGAGPGMPPQ